MLRGLTCAVIALLAAVSADGMQIQADRSTRWLAYGTPGWLVEGQVRFSFAGGTVRAERAFLPDRNGAAVLHGVLYEGFFPFRVSAQRAELFRNGSLIRLVRGAVVVPGRMMQIGFDGADLDAGGMLTAEHGRILAPRGGSLYQRSSLQRSGSDWILSIDGKTVPLTVPFWLRIFRGGDSR